MVLLSFLLARTIHPNWACLSVIVGVSLIQSAITGFCPAETILKAFTNS